MLKRMKEQHEQYFPEDSDVIHQLQNILFICSVLNEKKDALKYLLELERSFVMIGPWVHLGSTVLLDNIREEPEFKDIMLRVERKKQEFKAQFVDLE